MSLVYLKNKIIPNNLKTNYLKDRFKILKEKYTSKRVV